LPDVRLTRMGFVTVAPRSPTDLEPDQNHRVHHAEYRHPRLVEVYDSECRWGPEDDLFVALVGSAPARVLELGCGTAALLTPIALDAEDSLFIRLTPFLESTPGFTTVVRVALSAMVLLVPATLMGATYPLVLRAASPTPDDVRRSASVLYAVNTTGAIAGVLFGSLWLVPALGA